MKVRMLVNVLLVMGGIFIAGILLLRLLLTEPQLPPTAKQMGLTNGTVGRITAAFSKSAPKNAAFVQEWLRTGTNAVLFEVVNRHKFSIWVFPYAKMDIKGDAPTNYLTFLADARSTFGIYLNPGEAALLQIPELPAHGLSQATFSHSRSTDGHALPDKLRRWWGECYRFLTKKPPENYHTFYSDWFTQ